LCHPKLEGGFSAGTKGVSIVAGIRTISLRGKIQEKTMPRKFIIKLRRSATMLYHPELEGAFSAGTKGVSITALLKFLLLTALTNIFLLSFCSQKTCYNSFAIPKAYTGYEGCP
jgi:hypothetical protein